MLVAAAAAASRKEELPPLFCFSSSDDDDTAAADVAAPSSVVDMAVIINLQRENATYLLVVPIAHHFAIPDGSWRQNTNHPMYVLRTFSLYSLAHFLHGCLAHFSRNWHRFPGIL